MLPYRRADRVAEGIQRELCDLLLKGKVKDPRVGMVTITGVKLSNDLRDAKVSFSTLGNADEHRKTGQGLTSAAGFLRGEIARALRLRVAPTLVFVFDESFERAGRLAEVFEQIRQEGDGA